MRSKKEILAYQRDWYSRNRERVKASRIKRKHVTDEWRRRNREEINARMRRYRKNNPDIFKRIYEKQKESGRTKEKARRRYERHAHRLNAQSREYYRINRDVIAINRREYAKSHKLLIKERNRNSYKKRKRRAITHMMLNLNKLNSLLNKETP